MSEPLRITKVYHWANGMTMVFDQHGHQMPEYQGATAEMLPKLAAAGWNKPAIERQWPTAADKPERE